MMLLGNLGEFSPSISVNSGQAPHKCEKKWEKRSKPDLVGFFHLQTTLDYLCPPFLASPITQLGACSYAK